MPGEPFVVRHGASWVTPDGRVIHLQGFHDSWLRAHPGLTGGARNTAEFVQKSGWASAVMHDEGYLELILRDRADPKSVDFIWNILKANEAQLRKVVIMILGDEGYIMVAPDALGNRAGFEAALVPTL